MTSTIPNMFYMLFIVFQTAQDVAVQTMITQQAPLCLQKKSIVDLPGLLYDRFCVCLVCNTCCGKVH